MNARVENLKERRKKFYSQQEFARLIGIDPCHLSRVETGSAQFSQSTKKLVEAILALHEQDTRAAKKILLRQERKGK